MRRRTGIWVGAVVIVAVLVPTAVAVARTTGATRSAATGRATGGVTPTTTVAPARFTHPGVLVGRAQLDLVRSKVDAGEQPWKSAYDQMRTSQYASLSRDPKPRSTVECGSRSNPDNGCTEERTDGLAAYADALMWYIARDDRYARKAIQIMDAWSAVLKEHTNSNAPLQAGWSAANWARAAELIKHTYPAGWPGGDRFATMLRTVYLPVLINGSGANGNWELIMTDAAMGIAVFLDDRASFDKAVATWRGRVPAYVYLKSDGGQPLSPPNHKKNGGALVDYWYGQTTLVDGVAQETCRDFGHTAMGLNAAFHGAETARLQGVDLWREQQARLAAAMEFHARYETGEPAPSWLCHGKIDKGTGSYWEPGYNALHTRLGVDLPGTRKLIETRRPMDTDNHSSGWETLTSVDAP